MVATHGRDIAGRTRLTSQCIPHARRHLSKRIASDGRSGWLSNALLTAASSLFVVLLVIDLITRFG